MKTILTPVKQISVLATALSLALIASYAYGSWSDPSGTPPANNVDAPINVGPDSQSKTGGILGAPIFSATNHMRSNWYCDSAGYGADTTPGTADDTCVAQSALGGGGGGGSDISYVTYRLASGQSSPSITGLGWQPVDFNTEVHDSANQITLGSSGEFTLTGGNFVEWKVSFRTRGFSRGATRVRDVSTGAIVEFGNTYFSGLEDWDDTTVVLTGGAFLPSGTYVVEAINVGNRDSSVSAASVGDYEQYATMKIY